MALLLKRISIFLFLLIIVNPLYSNDKKTLNFAPLPTKEASKNIEDFLAINSYLQKKLSIDIKYIYKHILIVLYITNLVLAIFTLQICCM